MPLDTTYRSQEEEIMDDFTLEGETFGVVLENIASINKWLGGNSITLKALSKIFANHQSNVPLRIVDAGCGGGDMCRQVAKWARNKNMQVEIIGVDANAFAVQYAAEKSLDFQEISYRHIDIFSNEFYALKPDVLLCTLTLHHFKDADIFEWLSKLLNHPIHILVNDLQRSKIAYRLFQLVGFIFRLEQMNISDGLVSILRGFKKQELSQYFKQLKIKHKDLSSEMSWKWAFRYLWIIRNK